MILKNYSKKSNKKPKINWNKYFTYKNLFFFLISFFLISFVLGIFFYFHLKSEDQLFIKENLSSYFKIPDQYEYLKLFLKSVCNNSGNLFFFWLLGISILGIPFLLFFGFIESFSFGLQIASIFHLYKAKGIFGMLCYVLPSNLFLFLLTFFLIYFAIKFGIQFVQAIFFKKKEELAIKKYVKTLFLALGISLVLSIFEVFLSPFFIKFFTFVQK